MLLVLVLGFAVGMGSLLNYFKFESTVHKLQQSRIALVAAEAHAAMEKSLALGAVLAESATLQGLIERLRHADPLILTIDLLDEEGRAVLRTGGKRASHTVPSHWIKAAQRPGAHEWFRAEDDAFVVGRVVRNSFDVVTGSVVVRYERSGFDRMVKAMGLYLGEVGLISIAAAALLGNLVLLVLLLSVRRDFVALERWIAGDASMPSAGRTVLEREMRSFRASVGAAEREIEEIGESLSGSVMPAGASR